MKKNFGLWLNIVTICLCVCAIAIGVYAASTATLTVSGQVGFEAHGVELTVDGTLSGYVTTANGTEIQNNTELTQVVLTKTTNTGAMSLGEDTVYFTDLVGDSITPITLKLTFTNNSKFAVRANVSVPATTTNNVNISADKTTLPLGENGGTGEVTYTFSIDNANTSIDNASTTDMEETVDLSKITGLKVDFVKLTEYYQGELYVQNGRLYVEYGYYPEDSEDEETVEVYDNDWNEVVETNMYGDNLGKPIRWVAIMDTTGVTTNFTTLTSVPSSGNFYFVSEYAFDNHVFNTTYNAPVNGKNPNDYAGSEIRTYLNNGFVEKYQLTNLINDTRLGEGRALPTEEITNFVKTSGSYHANYAEGYITNNKANAIAGCQDKLWLLNADDEVSAVNTVMGTYKGFYPSQTDQIYNANITECGAYWWLRSPFAVDYNYARCVVGDGVVDLGNVNTAYALRPAFQLTIPA